MISVIFICLGNICRSPALEETLRLMIEKKGLAEKITVDSCGLNSYFLGSKADPMMRKVAEKYGVEIRTRAKLIQRDFFPKFYIIFVVDRGLLEMVKSQAPNKKMASKVHLVTEYSKRFPNQDIPDPYGGPENGFELAMEMIEDSSRGILEFLERQI